MSVVGIKACISAPIIADLKLQECRYHLIYRSNYSLVHCCKGCCCYFRYPFGDCTHEKSSYLVCGSGHDKPEYMWGDAFEKKMRGRLRFFCSSHVPLSKTLNNTSSSSHQIVGEVTPKDSTNDYCCCKPTVPWRCRRCHDAEIKHESLEWESYRKPITKRTKRMSSNSIGGTRMVTVTRGYVS